MATKFPALIQNPRLTNPTRRDQSFFINRHTSFLRLPTTALSSSSSSSYPLATSNHPQNPNKKITYPNYPPHNYLVKINNSNRKRRRRRRRSSSSRSVDFGFDPSTREVFEAIGKTVDFDFDPSTREVLEAIGKTIGGALILTWVFTSFAWRLKWNAAMKTQPCSSFKNSCTTLTHQPVDCCRCYRHCTCAEAEPDDDDASDCELISEDDDEYY